MNDWYPDGVQREPDCAETGRHYYINGPDGWQCRRCDHKRDAACECRSCVTPQSPTAETTQGALTRPAPRRGDWNRDGTRAADRHVGALS